MSLLHPGLHGGIRRWRRGECFPTALVPSKQMDPIHPDTVSVLLWLMCASNFHWTLHRDWGTGSKLIVYSWPRHFVANNLFFVLYN